MPVFHALCLSQMLRFSNTPEKTLGDWFRSQGKVAFAEFLCEAGGNISALSGDGMNGQSCLFVFVYFHVHQADLK